MQFYCAICGAPKTHYRILGYRCSTQDHYEQETENVRRTINEKAVHCPDCNNAVSSLDAYCVRCGHELGEYRGDGVPTK